MDLKSFFSNVPIKLRSFRVVRHLCGNPTTGSYSLLWHKRRMATVKKSKLSHRENRFRRPTKIRGIAFATIVVYVLWTFRALRDSPNTAFDGLRAFPWLNNIKLLLLLMYGFCDTNVRTRGLAAVNYPVT